MTEQVIYSRYEYPAHNILMQEIFEEYRGMSICDERGIVVGGASVSIREGSNRATIILTYDLETDVFMKLKLTGIKGLKVTHYHRKDNV